MNTKTDPEIKHEINVFSAFKKHLVVFLVANSLVWLAWFASGGQLNLYSLPTYVSMAWGFILMAHLLLAYNSFRTINKKSR
jgi:hypothetical protein